MEIGTLKELNVKPGDVVEALGGRTFKVTKVVGEKVYAMVQSEGYESRIVSNAPYRIISRANPSPVRTVTRKEIVPGVYGKVSVQGKWKDKVGIAIVGSPIDAESSVTVLIGHVQLSSDELRAAAETLIQIADALENNA